MSCRYRDRVSGEKRKLFFGDVPGAAAPVADGVVTHSGVDLGRGGRNGWGMRVGLVHRCYSLPFHAPVRTAHGVWAEREGVMVRVEDESGRVGFGEAAPIPWFGTETLAEIVAALERLGAEPTEAELRALPAELACLRFAATCALGGARGGKATREHLPVAALLPAGRAALGAVEPKAEMGFRTFKWKVGVGDVADELALLDDLIGRLPSGSRLRLDANGAWDRRVAARWMERVAERPVEFVEQPIAADARGADDVLLGLAGDYPTPIGLDESLVGERDVERWIGAGWPGVYVVKIPLLGDPAGTLARLAAAKADVVFSSALETAAGARTALEMAFAWDWPAVPRALGFGVWPLFHEMVLNGPGPAPFIRAADVARMDVEAAWNALR